MYQYQNALMKRRQGGDRSTAAIFGPIGLLRTSLAAVMSLARRISRLITDVLRLLGQWPRSPRPLVRRGLVMALATLPAVLLLPEIAHAAPDLASMAGTGDTQVSAAGKFIKAFVALIGYGVAFYGLYMLTLGKKKDPRENSTGMGLTFLVGGTAMGIVATIMAITANTAGIGETQIDQNEGAISAGDGN